METSHFNKFPAVRIKGHAYVPGWEEIIHTLRKTIQEKKLKKTVICLEVYPGADAAAIRKEVVNSLNPGLLIDTADLFRPESEIRALTDQDLGEDPVFGTLSYLQIDDFLDSRRIARAASKVSEHSEGVVVIIGTGAVRVARADILVYADMARWEIQQRQRRDETGNLGLSNGGDSPGEKYKRAFFVDWRVADRVKRATMDEWDFVLDTNDRETPKMISGDLFRKSLEKAVTQPIELVPFFDPGPWGGQWMKEVCDLDRNKQNFAWCFNCVPEENSMMFAFDNGTFEIPSINLVFYKPKELLGERVFARFGAEFPIRFDFLDTWEGGNLSLQVHPLTDYIQNTFGWHYTQDESYYLMDTKPDASVYLGVKHGVDPENMFRELEDAQNGGAPFEAEKYAANWPAKKHDHFLIPAGTLHCSGKNGVVLEISSTPYIFTFKLWDWGRMGLDGKPRPVHIHHGRNVLQFDRTPDWVEPNLINRIEQTAEGDGWREEKTGLHELEFIETRRHWFTKRVEHDTGGGVNVLNLVEGEEVIVESPDQSFDPFIVHYAETFVIPAAVGRYVIRPHGPSAGKECATIKAFVRG